MNQKLMDTEYHWLRQMCGGDVPDHVRELAEDAASRFRMVSSAPLSRDTLALIIATAEALCDCDGFEGDDEDVPDKTLAAKKGSKVKPKGPKRPVKKPSYETPEEEAAVAKVAELVGA